MVSLIVSWGAKMYISPRLPFFRNFHRTHNISQEIYISVDKSRVLLKIARFILRKNIKKR